MEFGVWEARFASRGGTYYFVLRERRIIPVSDLGKEIERHPTARGPRVRYTVELSQDDAIVEVEVGSARSARKGQRGYLHVEMAKQADLQGKAEQEWHTVLKNAPVEVVDLILASSHVPIWMKKRIQTWGVWR